MSTALKRKVAPWLLTTVLLAGAWALVEVTLPEGSAQAPFPTAAAIGETASARNLTVTITDVHAARRVEDADGWSAEGTWLVVDLEAATDQTQVATVLGLATLTIDDREFIATDRGTTFYRTRLFTGVARSGSLAFELPDDALSGTATLHLGLTRDVVLDGMIELSVDLDELSVESEVPLDETRWAR
ncbi:hypothetical protein [Microbacterium sp. SD291]|uniref:hypothetical protein n=1 Tax=Microbacterium sp. SD291 TaxID=2782007 RepID=UPI001A956E54|nr:hypothetical protein [Microbacterium sp. SD291]MBO0979685.1 hypothetical protein [Microbacterium sp. SD291]